MYFEVDMLKELLFKNRSIRSFDKNIKISKEELLDMIDCTRLCPSSANLQSMKFAPINDERLCEIIFSATKWAGYLKDEVIPPKGNEPSAYIIVCNDKIIAPNTTAFFKDTGIVAHTILLRACEMGYGGCMIGSFDKNIIKDALSLSDDLEITLVIAMGKPLEEPIITDCKDDIKYYRKNGIHYVPKRSLDDIIIK